MNSRSVFLAIAAGLLVAGIGALDARAASVPLPTTYDMLLPAGATTTVVGAEVLTFSGFGYASSTTSGGTTTTGIPLASTISVNPFTNVANETGLNFGGSLSAAAGSVVDLAITYTVSAPAGELINDALSISAGGPIGGIGTGTYTINETLVNAANPGITLATLNTGLGSPSASASFAGVQSVFVTKDIFLTGGTNGVSLSVISQGFSSIPEPTSVALLGIGMTGFLAFRRLFKRASVA